MKLKLFVVALLLVLVGCGKPANTLPNGQKLTKEEVDQAVAKLDGVPGQTQPYKAVLDRLESRCNEDRLTLAGIAMLMNKKTNAAGFKSNNLDMLRTLLDLTNGFEKPRNNNCMSLESYYAESLKPEK